MRRVGAFTGSILIVVGAAVYYLYRYGADVTYTKTYRNLVNVVPPAIDVDMLVVALAISVQLFVVATSAFKDQRRVLPTSPRRRRHIVWASGGVAILGLATLIGAYAFRLPMVLNLFASSTNVFILAAFTALAVACVYYALTPPAYLMTEQSRTLLRRIGAFGLACVAGAIGVLASELMTQRPARQTLLNPSTLRRHDATHAVSVILETEPRTITAGESLPITVLFRLTRYGDPAATGPRYPIMLNTAHRYAVSATLRAVGFEISSPDESATKSRPCSEGQLLRWEWLVMPKGGTEGTRQAVAVDLVLLDLTTGNIVFDVPTATVNLDVRTPLGLPTWLLSPGVALGSIIGGLLAMFAPAMFERWVAHRDSEVH